MAKKNEQPVVEQELAPRREQPQLLTTIEHQQQAIIEACSGSIEYISIMSSLKKAITNDPRILSCTPTSVLNAVLACAKLGIDPSGVQNTAWFVRYGNDLQLMIGYAGYIDLITRSGTYQQVEAEVVYDGEHYEVYRGTRNEIIHQQDYSVRNDQDNQIISAYAIARGASGMCQFVALSRNDINTARSASKNQHLWDKHLPEMCKKTAVRNLAKWMVLDSIGQYATAISDGGDGYDFGQRARQSTPSTLRNRVGNMLGETVETEPEIIETELDNSEGS